MKKILAFILATVMIFNCSINIFAVETQKKEEVVYAILNEDGALNKIYVVNSFENYGENVVDYGDYKSVRKLNSEDELKLENGEVSFNSKVDKFYYEGEMSAPKLPWNVSIGYKLDGNSVKASELAGKSGDVEITVDMTQNPEINPVFYENYALQLSIIFDSNKCKDILSEGATIASAGESKIVNHTLLPKSGGKIVVTTKATDFAMGNISINAIPFTMNVEIDGIDKITEGFKALNDGILELKNGSNQLTTGASEYKKGISALSGNSGAIRSGSSQIKTALEQLEQGLSGMGELTAPDGGIAKLVEGSSNFKAGVDQIPNILKGVIAEDAQTKQLLAAASQSADPLVQGLLNLYNGKMQALEVITANIEGMTRAYGEINTAIAGIGAGLQSITQLQEGIKTLSKEYGAFNDGLSQYTKGVEQTSSGFTKINEGIVGINTGINALYDNTKDMDKDVQEQIDEAMSGLGGDFEQVSFVSDKNTGIENVQFVIRTDAISTPKAEVAEEEEPKKLSFWEKFINLFM